MWKLNVTCQLMRKVGSSLFIVMFRVEVECHSEKGWHTVWTFIMQKTNDSLPYKGIEVNVVQEAKWQT
jgi:hypothetical protein